MSLVQDCFTTVRRNRGLSPGQVTDLYMYDPDQKKFSSIGIGTVSEDATRVVSDAIIKRGGTLFAGADIVIADLLKTNATAQKTLTSAKFFSGFSILYANAIQLYISSLSFANANIAGINLQIKQYNELAKLVPIENERIVLRSGTFVTVEATGVPDTGYKNPSDIPQFIWSVVEDRNEPPTPDEREMINVIGIVGKKTQAIFANAGSGGKTFVRLDVTCNKCVSADGSPVKLVKFIEVHVVSVGISDTLGVIKGLPAGVDITVSPDPLPEGDQVTLALATITGSGSATFADGSTSMIITGSTNVLIKGVKESSSADNIKLSAKFNGKELASDRFSVVWVTVTFHNSGDVSTNNSKRDNYHNVTGTYNLGPINTNVTFATGMEVEGMVSPPDFTGVFKFRRTIDARRYKNGLLLPGTGRDKGTYKGPDDSPDEYQDLNPQGGIFDLDAPGYSVLVMSGDNESPVGTILQFRANFKEFVECEPPLGFLPCSEEILWYSTQAIEKSLEPNTWIRNYSNPNDNQVGMSQLPNLDP